MRVIVLFFLLSGMLGACNSDVTTVAENKLQIVTTIKPIQSVLIAIAGDLVDASQLIPDGASPHDYNFKPSDIRKIKNADIIFRIDENMEAFLQPVLTMKKENSLLVSLADEEGMTLLSIMGRHAEEEKEEGERHEKNASFNEQHDHGDIDLHIWTSPKNSIVMAKVITASLIKLDADNASTYQNNLAAFTQAVESISNELTEELALVKDKPYIVFHNSWQYFADYFGLKKPRIVSLHHGVSSSAKAISGIRQQIVSQKARCVFSEPGIRSSQIKTLIENLEVKTTEIDVLQIQFDANKESYVNWLKSTGDKIRDCLN